MFKAAAGSLGWSPKVIWSTPVPQLILAIEGKYDFAVKTNPFGASKKLTPEQEERINAQKAKLDLMSIQSRQKQMGMK